MNHYNHIYIQYTYTSNNILCKNPTHCIHRERLGLKLIFTFEHGEREEKGLVSSLLWPPTAQACAAAGVAPRGTVRQSSDGVGGAKVRHHLGMNQEKERGRGENEGERESHGGPRP